MEEQIKIMEGQINGPADFTLIEKLMYLEEYFKSDTMFSIDIVRSNLVRELKRRRGCISSALIAKKR